METQFGDCSGKVIFGFTEREKKVALSPSIAIEQIPEKIKKISQNG